MFVLGLQGSPRKNGNSSVLLAVFMEEAARLGARTHVVDVADMAIQPCCQCQACERQGFCPLPDDMRNGVYPLLWQADLIVMATPVFFYSVPAQLKALIDRAQVLWTRKYGLRLEDPGRKWRSGFVLAVGATKGENLFQGLNLTAKYFFDAVGATYKGSLGYRRIEHVGDVAAHATAFSDVRAKARDLMAPYLSRRKMLFVSDRDACGGQMAQAFTQFHAGDAVEALSAGKHPAAHIDDLMVQVMAEKGIDMAFRKPISISAAMVHSQPDLIVSMSGCSTCSTAPEETEMGWDLADPDGQTIGPLRALRDEIEQRVKGLFKISL